MPGRRGRRALLAMALPTLLLPASAHADARVRFLNARLSDDPGSLDIVRGARTLTTKRAPFGGVTRYMAAPAGRVRLRHLPKSGRDVELAAVLQDGQTYTVAAVGAPGREVLRIFSEASARRSTALVRVVHLAPELGSPDLQVDGTTVARAFPYLAKTPYTPLTPGEHTLSAMNPRSKSTVISADVNLRRGTVSSAYVVGGAGMATRAVLTSDARPARTATRPRRGRAVHVVRPGESLWSIAERWLGEDATDPEIWDEVVRIWNVNKDHIPSGDPDLIHPGLRLRMR
jgi:hypothetical protein